MWLHGPQWLLRGLQLNLLREDMNAWRSGATYLGSCSDTISSFSQDFLNMYVISGFGLVAKDANLRVELFQKPPEVHKFSADIANNHNMFHF